MKAAKEAVMVDDSVLQSMGQCELLPVAFVHGSGDDGSHCDDEAALGLVVRTGWVEVSIESHRAVLRGGGPGIVVEVESGPGAGESFLGQKVAAARWRFALWSRAPR